MSGELNHNPDVLNCLANLSNDEVFTPPEIANAVLDMLPKELWSNSKTKILDPATKSGVFLREAAKRLIKGLEKEIPDLQQRIDHIMHNQLFGYAITDLTSHLSRRSLYCSKNASGPYSISKFKNMQGNILYEEMEHTWKGDKCEFCGAAKKEFSNTEKDTHAYSFIHMDKKTEKELTDMKFDLIISNPPYQLSDGGAQASAKPIYHLFINQAKKLKPRYITMIVPSRWMTGGKGLDKFRDEMIHDKCITKLYDFLDPKDIFNGVDIKGGVCYFLRDSHKQEECEIHTFDVRGETISKRFLAEENTDIFIRNNILLGIKKKIEHFGPFFDTIVSASKPYGLRAETMVCASKYGLPDFSDKPIIGGGGYRIIGLGEKQRRTWKYLPFSYPIPKRNEGLDKYKVFIAEAYGCGAIGEVPSTPVLSTPGELCTETFLQIGPFDTKEEASNIIKYIRTKTFRCLVGIQKQTQHTTAKAYRFVPMQNFTNTSDINWSLSVPEIDEQLYKKYNFSEEEISFIEFMIKPMDLSSDGGSNE